MAEVAHVEERACDEAEKNHQEGLHGTNGRDRGARAIGEEVIGVVTLERAERRQQSYIVFHSSASEWGEREREKKCVPGIFDMYCDGRKTMHTYAVLQKGGDRRDTHPTC